MTKKILTVTLNPAIDETVKIQKFKVGEDFLCEDVNHSAGGKGINVARVLKQLGVPTLACGLVAGPAGEFIRSGLKAEGIAHEFVATQGNTRTSLTIIDHKSKKITRVLQDGPAVTGKDLQNFVRVYKKVLKTSSAVILSGRSAQGARQSIYGDLIKIARHQKKLVLLDAHSRPFAEGLKAKPSIITPNRDEAEEVLGVNIFTPRQKILAVESFLNRGINNVIITFGSEGAIGSNGDGMWIAKPPKVALKNNVGCGDAFNAGFMFYFQKKKKFPECLCMGAATGTANAQSTIPGKIRKKQLAETFKKVKIQML